MIDNPFSISQKLLAYVKGDDVSELDRLYIENLIEENSSIRELYEELQDRGKITEQLLLMNSFDAEKALRKIKRRRYFHEYRFWLQSVAAIIAVVLFSTIFYYEINGWNKNGDYDIAQIGSGVVTLQIADGQVLSLNNISDGFADNNLTYRLSDGTLVLKEIEHRDSVHREALNMITVPDKSTYKMVLQDGTKVTLNSGSSLTFPSSLSDGQRVVELRGEACFDVAKVEGREFIVKTKHISITVLGTLFNVKSYDTEKEVVTTLVNGSIQLDYGSEMRKMLPGEQAIYSKVEQKLNIRSVDAQKYTSWTNNIFNFDDTSLDDIMNQLSRWYGLSVKYNNIDLDVRNVVYSGKMKMYNHPADILRKFEHSGDLKFELKDNTIIISKK